MNIEYLGEFAYLAECLSFKRTAERFFVSRSVISRHLTSLEHDLGTTLLERDGRGVSLTATGELFAQEARIILQDWERAKLHVQELSSASDSLIRIGYLRNGARPFLVNFVKHMSSNHPEIRLSLACMGYREARKALEEQRVDVVIGINVDRSVSRNYRSTLVYRDRFVIACNRGNQLAQRPDATVTLDDLRDQKLLVPDSYISSGLGRAVEELVDDDVLAKCEELYQDMDLLYLKIQTEDHLAFVSALNAVMFDGPLAMLDIEGIDTSFDMRAFYSDTFTGRRYELCRENFKVCKQILIEEHPELPAFM